MAGSVCLNWCVLRKEDGDALRRELVLEVMASQMLEEEIVVEMDMEKTA